MEGLERAAESEFYRIKADLLMDVKSEDALGLEGRGGFEGLYRRTLIGDKKMPEQKQIF